LVNAKLGDDSLVTAIQRLVVPIEAFRPEKTLSFHAGLPLQTFAAFTTASVWAALLATAIWLAFALPINALLLLNNALAARFSATIVAALNAVAVRNANVDGIEGV